MEENLGQTACSHVKTSAVASSGILSAEGKTNASGFFVCLFVSVLCYEKKKMWSRALRSSTPGKRFFPVSPSDFSFVRSSGV